MGVGRIGLVAGLGGGQPVLGSAAAGERDDRLDHGALRGLADPCLSIAADESVMVQGLFDIGRMGLIAGRCVVMGGERAVERG